MGFVAKVQDNFNDVNFTELAAHTPQLGSGYSADHGDLAIFGNELWVNTVPAYYRNLTALANKQYALITVDIANVSVGCGVLTAVSGGNFTGYYLYLPGNGLDFVLRKFTGSGTTTTDLQTFSTAGSNGGTMRLESNGAGVLTAYAGSNPSSLSSIGTVSDGSYTSGDSMVVGIGGGTQAATYFEAGDDAGGLHFRRSLTSRLGSRQYRYSPSTRGWGPVLTGT